MWCCPEADCIEVGRVVGAVEQMDGVVWRLVALRTGVRHRFINYTIVAVK